MEKISGIYGLRCRITEKWYVGQSVDVMDRWRQYAKLKCKKQRHLYSALCLYGFSNFETHLLEKCDPTDWILGYREMYWIRMLDCVNNGYNLTVGGACGGGIRSIETRKRMSDAARLRGPLSQDIKRKISEAAKERLKNPENNANFGKKHSEETKMKLSIRAKERLSDPTKNPMYGKRKYSYASKEERAAIYRATRRERYKTRRGLVTT